MYQKCQFDIKTPEDKTYFSKNMQQKTNQDVYVFFPLMYICGIQPGERVIGANRSFYTLSNELS